MTKPDNEQVADDQKEELKQTIEELEEITTLFHSLGLQLDKMRVNDLLRNYTEPKRIIVVNLIAGLSRGIGLTVGTAIFLAILGVFLSQFISLPIIGEYIAKLVDVVDAYRAQNFTAP